MSRDEALELIAALMNEWFAHERWTAKGIADDLAEIEEDEARARDPVLWYPVFALEILERGGVIE